MARRADRHCIVLNRPATRNALDLATLRKLLRASRAKRDALLVITSRGRAFCSGLDLREIRARRTARQHLERLIDLHEALATRLAPTLSIVRGPARGGGAALAWCCDSIVAAPAADFAIPWAAGYRPLARSLLPLIAARRGVGRRNLPLGRTFSARQAKRVGLIDHVMPDASIRAAGLAALARRARRRRRADARVFRKMRRLSRAADTPAARAALMRYLSNRFPQ
jgi:enoyl-CoA hydratase/carnithine racemase